MKKLWQNRFGATHTHSEAEVTNWPHLRLNHQVLPIPGITVYMVAIWVPGLDEKNTHPLLANLPRWYSGQSIISQVQDGQFAAAGKTETISVDSQHIKGTKQFCRPGVTN